MGWGKRRTENKAPIVERMTMAATETTMLCPRESVIRLVKDGVCGGMCVDGMDVPVPCVECGHDGFHGGGGGGE